MGEVNIFNLMDLNMLRTGSSACNQKQCQPVTWTVHKELSELVWRWLPGKQVSYVCKVAALVQLQGDTWANRLGAILAHEDAAAAHDSQAPLNGFAFVK